MTESLRIENLHVAVEGREIVRGVTLEVNQGEVHALMGPNGSGKSSLANALMGHPSYKVIEGSVTFKGQDVLSLGPDERARLGLFLAFQYPREITGVSVANFLRRALNARLGQEVPLLEFHRMLREKLALLQMESSIAERYLNDGFSGGEKKRTEILQMSVLRPEMAILDETDSGLDIDALKIVANGVNAMRGPNLGVLVITHYQRILRYIQPDFVHVMISGNLVESGGRELAERLEEQGYDAFKAKEVASVG